MNHAENARQVRPRQVNRPGAKRAGYRAATAPKALLAALIVSGSLFALSSPSAAQLTQTRKSDGSERRICRYTEVTGRLSKGRRVCLTRAEWERVAEEQRKSARAWLQAIDSCGTRGEGGAC